MNEAEVKPNAIAPEMPKTLSRAARREWHFIVRKLLALNILTEIDGKALAAYCESYAIAEQASRDIKKYGQLIEEPVVDKLGHAVLIEDRAKILAGSPDFMVPLVRLKENPAVRTWMNAQKTMKAFLIEFGLTPATRAKLKIGKKDEEPGEDYFNRPRRIAGESKPLLVPAAPSQKDSETSAAKAAV